LLRDIYDGDSAYLTDAGCLCVGYRNQTRLRQQFYLPVSYVAVVGFLPIGRGLICDRWCFLYTCAVVMLDPSEQLHSEQDHDGTLLQASLTLG